VHETTLAPSKLQADFVKIPAKERLPKVTYEFTAVPRGALQSIKSHLHAVYLALVEALRLGIVDPAVGWIASYTGKKDRQVRRDLSALCGLGLIQRIFRRVRGNRNKTNIYRIPAMERGGGVGVMCDREKREGLKTTTPDEGGARPRPEKSEKQKLHEARFAQDRADSKWMREWYEAQGRFWRTSTAWMRHKMEHVARRRAEACVGYNPTPPPTPEQEAEWIEMRNRREAERIARAKAELEAKAQRKKDSEREWWAFVERNYPAR
jgi:hypothetical protein